MLFFASIIAALGVTLFLVSYIAKMLLAKRPGMGWIFLAWITGGILAMLAMIPLGMFASNLDPQVLFIVTLLLSFVISSAAYKYINQMGWGGAFTTNIASIVIGMITFVVAILASGNSIQGTLDSFDQLAKQKAAMSGALAEGDFSADTLTEAIDATQQAEEQSLENVEASEDIVDADEEPVFKEKDLLPKGTLRELQAKEKPYVSPKYHVVSIGKIGSYIGRPIRVNRTNGKTIKGALVAIRGNSAVIKRRIHNGLATTPIALSTISKLEVYR